MRLDVKLSVMYDISRQKAQDALKQQRVLVNGQIVSKSSLEIKESDVIELKSREIEFVSRSGYKLEEVIQKHDVDITGMTCIDIGASTGGFTDCLLQRSAKSVTAVDVGTMQLHPKLRNDPRVNVMENTNARNLTVKQFEGLFDLLVMDVSFISVKLLIEGLNTLIKPEGLLFILIKPQFEVGEKYLNKHGIVSDEKYVLKMLNEYRVVFKSLGLAIVDCHKASMTGRDGNQEYIFYLKKP
ncbi:MAG: TlyA family rRNA (cytidine-2'-O)-methyltransferase [Firmicutes bacterium HGW-Firmicutes-19]|jgi:23S rRNA (cytidine1920-2'-O)/16S rRNA (cytidine1409-2'-O)-methyltransferase|nr:MAG: TlyA family rRNA (cytidine-2'-O)-methyltransferase [Firmicutes bacterium HGW-Firmicutes-19]